jgi:DNA-binding Lrp family transcriptional regulator
MEKIDVKDWKILYQLDLNSRQSNTELGKKVGLRKDVVAYRIKRLEETGVINFYWTAIDTFKLGYDVFRIYITFQYVDVEKKKEIINHFVKCKDSWLVVTAKGEIDLNVILWVKDPYQFYQYWDKTLDLYADYFAKTTISLYIQAIDFKKSYLDKEEKNDTDRELYHVTSTRDYVSVDELDYQLLNELAMHARTPLIDLAETLSCSSQSVKYRLDNLIKKEVVKGFRIGIDYAKLGLQYYKLDIYLRDHKYTAPMTAYLRNKPYLQCLNIAIGWADIEPELIVKDIGELGQIMNELNSRFPNSMKRYTYWILEERFKERWLPEITFK